MSGVGGGYARDGGDVAGLEEAEDDDGVGEAFGIGDGRGEEGEYFDLTGG
jgi:hypothetical protein